MNIKYKENTANHPRLKTDVFFADYENTYKYVGFVYKAIRYIEENGFEIKLSGQDLQNSIEWLMLTMAKAGVESTEEK